MDDQLEALETRIAHQDLAIDELTAQSLRQQRMLDELIGHVEKLQHQVRALAEDGHNEIIDAPPPHY